MEAIAEKTEAADELELSVLLPPVGEYVPCEQCHTYIDAQKKLIKLGRSYMWFLYKDDLFSFCKHHGEKNEEKLISLGGKLVLDRRDTLIENRLQGPV